MGRKRTDQTLKVYLNESHVGDYKQSSTGAVGFQYTPSWLDQDNSFAISYSLPLIETPYKGDKVSAFFENLLPEGMETRKKIAENLGAESHQVFDLLRTIGKDCVGALQFIEEGEAPPKKQKVKALPITTGQIEESLRKLPYQPLGLKKDQDFRISIAGIQNKLAYLKVKGKWMIPQGSTPTSHILKPAMGILPNGIDLTTSTENEWLCLKIAEYLGLKTAHADICRFNDQKALVVERFDRKWSADCQYLSRVHQEDLCQAFGVSSARKYESDGGPGIPDIMRFLNASDYRDEDRKTFFRAQIVYFLLAAIDGHAKNFSLFLTPTGFSLAPIYDVISVYSALSDRQIEIKEAKLAMSVGNGRKYRLKDIFKRHWEQTAQKCGFSRNDLDEIIEDLEGKISAGLKNKIDVPDDFPGKIVHEIIEGVEKTAQKLF